MNQAEAGESVLGEAGKLAVATPGRPTTLPAATVPLPTSKICFLLLPLYAPTHLSPTASQVQPLRVSRVPVPREHTKSPLPTV